MAEQKYYFGFRQIKPSPPGRWVACGPHDTFEAAMADRASMKAWDSEVDVPMLYASKEEAEKRLNNE